VFVTKTINTTELTSNNKPFRICTTMCRAACSSKHTGGGVPEKPYQPGLETARTSPTLHHRQAMNQKTTNATPGEFAHIIIIGVGLLK
jgi:hypothetical protein